MINNAGRIKKLESEGFFDYNCGNYTEEKYETKPLTMDEIIEGVKKIKDAKDTVLRNNVQGVHRNKS